MHTWINFESTRSAHTGEVIGYGEIYTGEPGIDWDDEENEDKYTYSKIDSNEAFRVMESFAQSTQFDPKVCCVMP